MGDFLLSLAGGAALVLAPYLCWSAISASSESERLSRVGYAMLAVLAFAFASYLALSSWGFLIAAPLTAAVVYKRSQAARRRQIDFVVEGPLLSDAVSPELSLQMTILAEKAQEGQLVSEEPNPGPS